MPTIMRVLYEIDHEYFSSFHRRILCLSFDAHANEDRYDPLASMKYLNNLHQRNIYVEVRVRYANF